MELVDTHCHIQEAGSITGDAIMQEKWAKAGVNDPRALISEASAAGVTRLICVGCTLRDSEMAVELASKQARVWASIGIHPHETKQYTGNTIKLQNFCNLIVLPKVVAVGECGLDYYYEHSPRHDQKKLLRFQIELALENNLPLVFHIRDAFDDFWKIFDSYTSTGQPLRGVVHSFSASQRELDQILERDLYTGLNGIMTFTKDNNQVAAAKAVPLQKLLLETDAPFLTPEPFRGTICQPKHVLETARFLAELRGESLELLAAATTKNARDLFNI